jgi:signal transduction histidine kinase
VDAVATESGATREGARLGLAVTHQIVQQHGGEIVVASGAEGTLVVVSLPPAASLPSRPGPL